MINDLYLKFKELYLQTDGKILIQNIKLEQEPSICIKIDESGKVFDKLIAIDNSVIKDDLYDWFSIRNIKSKYLNSNKAVGNKMIFSSNNLSLFGRIDTFPMITYDSFEKLFNVKVDKNNKKTTAKANFYNKYQKKIKELFENIESPIALRELIEEMDFLSEDELKLINSSYITDEVLQSYYDKLVSSYECDEEQFYTEDKLYTILEQIKEEIDKFAPKQIKLKIFRDKDVKEYEKYELKYLEESLFAVNDLFIPIEDKLYGEPFLDNTLNADKPFMVSQTKKIQIPFPKSSEDVLYIKYLDDYLKANKGISYLNIENFEVSQKPFLNKAQFIFLKKKHYEIFEFLPNYIDKFEKKEFTLKNHLKAKKGKKLIEDKNPYKDKFLLEKDIDKLCDKKLIKNYFSNNIKGVDGRLETYIFLIRDSCFKYFRKSQISERDFFVSIEENLSDLIIYKYQKSDDKNIRTVTLESLNLKLSMQEYFKGEKVDIINKLDELKERLSSQEFKSLTKDEFLLLAGQMAYYLISQSESNDRTFRLAEHYLKAKNSQKIKEHIRIDLEKYKHKINLISKESKFKKALTLLISYEEDNKLTNKDLDLFLVGLVSDNIFYGN